MSGFGRYPFGQGPFGSFDWAKQVLFWDIPESDRQLDSANPDTPLENWADSCKPLFDELLTFAREFETLRDPDYVRTQFQDVISVTLLSAEVEEDGRTVRVIVDDPDPSDPLVPLGRTSVGWILTDASGREFTVNQVHKLSSAIIVTGNILPVTGVSPTGDAVLQPPSLIDIFGEDFAVKIDRHDPEVFQRSMVKNAWQLYGMKGAENAYDVVGKMAGYEVVALPLWRVNPVPSAIPSSHVYEIPVGSGKYYTDYPPARPRFDEVAADVIPLDKFCWEEPSWTSEGIVPPPGPLPDGTSVSDAIGSYTQGITIASTTDLGDGRWRIEVSGADLWPIASHGRWYATFTDPGADSGQFWLETTPVDLGGGSWTFEVLAGTSPTFGTTVDIDYQCDNQETCSYCKASLIRVEVRPTEILNEPDALLDGILERLRDRILAIVPIHVRLVDIVHIIGPTSVALGVAGTHLVVAASQQRSLFAYAGLGYYYDIFPADVIQVDPSHMVATPSFTASGTGDTIGGAAPAMTLTDAAGGFAPWMVGKTITIAGATTGANNGPFTITSYVSPTQIGYTNAGGVAEPFPGTWSVTTP